MLPSGRKTSAWIETTWAELDQRVGLIALGLVHLGAAPGQVIGIIGDNRPEWVMAEIASHAVGCLSLGIYRDSLGDELSYLLEYAGTRIVFAEDEEQVDKLLPVADRLPDLRHIVYDDPRGMRKYDDPRLISLDELERRGEALKGERADLYGCLVASGCGDQAAILCATSGTTARPKLAMLAPKPLLQHTASYLHADPIGPDDEYVSVLPLPWIMEQMYVMGRALYCRMKVNFVEEPETMMADLREIGPTFVLMGPRVWETIAADVRARILDSTPLKRWLYEVSTKLGWTAIKKGRRSWLADVLIYRALRDRLGFSQLRSAATGGAALGPETFRFFLAMGVPLRQLYGQTESMGAYTIHRSGDVDFDSVGVAFTPEIEIRIKDADKNGLGQVTVRHPYLFGGYYKDEAATGELMQDGWIQTGDAGYLDEKGHLVVMDRVRDLAATSQGDRFSPQYLENKLKFSPFVAEAVILGDGRPFLTAMICIRFAIVAKWAEKKRIPFTTYTDLSSRSEVYDLIAEELEHTNDTLPSAQRTRKFVLLYKELDADDGELTRTKKIRRGVISEKYAPIIDALYSDQRDIPVDTMIVFQDGSKQRINTRLRVEWLGAALAECGSSQ